MDNDYPTLVNGQLRPYKFRKDLKAISDLIELCFADTLDQDGKRYLRHMRRISQQKGTRFYSKLLLSNTSVPTSGFVWEAGGKVVGNLSLIPFYQSGKRIYMIANVAVHPHYRRQGIARALTKAAIQKVQQQGGEGVWLQVREDNQSAIHLYDSLDFQTVTKRTTWKLDPHDLSTGIQQTSSSDQSSLRIVPHRSKYWKQQRLWLDAMYPQEIRWHIPLKIHLMRPGLTGCILRMFEEVRIRQWCVANHSSLLGVLTWQSSRSSHDHLWLAAPPENIQDVLATVLLGFQRHYRNTRPMLLTFPADIGAETFPKLGFRKQQTLLWMHKTLT